MLVVGQAKENKKLQNPPKRKTPKGQKKKEKSSKYIHLQGT